MTIPIDRPPADIAPRRSLLRKLRLAGDLLLLALIATTLYFALFAYFKPDIPHLDTLRGYGDRNLHVAAFALLVSLTMIGRRWSIVVPLLFVVAAIALEFLQMLMPARSPDPVDLLASLVGVTLGVVLAVTGNALLRRLRSTPATAKR